MPRPRPLAERYWERVERRGPDECWPWTGCRGAIGHGTITIGVIDAQKWPQGRRPEGAHRVAWVFANGPIPDGLWVLHRCDNGWCQNPAHLFLGTHADNMADMAAKGRASYAQHPEIVRRGEEHSRAKLTDEQVMEIRRAYASGEAGIRELGDRFGVDMTAVAYAVKGRTWRHLPVVEVSPDARRRIQTKRRPRGAVNHKAKLTDADVVEIRRRWADGETTLALGAEYGVNASTISAIAKGRFWSHLPVTSRSAETERRAELARGKPGAANIKAKLDEDRVREIRARAAAGETCRELSAAFGVGYSAIDRIVKRISWAHVD